MGMTLIVFKAGRQISLKFLLRLYNQKDADMAYLSGDEAEGGQYLRVSTVCGTRADVFHSARSSSSLSYGMLANSAMGRNCELFT
jgi:hypothetical protein